MESRGLRVALRIWVVLVLLFLFVPIALIFLYAFDKSTVQSWPISGFTLRWFSVAWHDPDVRQAFLLSLKVGLLATVIALVLGSMVAYAVHTFAFFGREAVSFLLVLPLALPGIVTGIALSSFFSFTGTGLSILTIVIGHATFCIVVVYNNMVARLRRVPGSLSEASADLGARGWQTARLITLPMVAHGADLRRAAGLRAVLRRGHRHRVHRGRAEHAAAVDLRRDPARPAAARGQRGGLGRHPAHADPGRAGRAAGRLRGGNAMAGQAAPAAEQAGLAGR